MDTLTLRIAFGVVAVCVLVLFYGVTFRATRSAYSGWWCASLAAFICSSLLFALNGTDLQVVANPAGNVLGVVGAGCVWAAAASLSGRRWDRRLLLVAPVVVVIPSALGHPGREVWAGGTFYLAAMAVLIGLSVFEMLHEIGVERQRRVARPAYRFALTSLTAVSAVLSLYYALRTIVFVAVGPSARLFVVAFGGQATTLFTLVLLVVVTYSMSALSHEQQASELRLQASTDGMTGLLNRTEFLRQGQAMIGRARGPEWCVVVADLDDFKEVNDGYGHAAGDEALLIFAELCARAVGDHGIVARLGGDEFAMLLLDEYVEDLVEELAVQLAAAPSSHPVPTASFGIAPVGENRQLAAVLAQADVALYQAKAAGRACAVRFDGRLPTPLPPRLDRPVVQE